MRKAKTASVVLGDAGTPLPYDPLAMQRQLPTDPVRSLRLFKLSGRAAVILSLLTVAAVGLALLVRYVFIQNTPLGLACDAGERSLACAVRMGAIHLFVRSVFGLTALVAALVQLWRPNIVVFAIALLSAGFGLVLYNTRLSALAVALLVLSFARAWPAKL
jgi:hypothetical protein